MAQDNRFTHDGIVYEDLGNGNVRVVGYADQQEAPQAASPMGITIGSPKPNFDDRKEAREQAKFDREAREWAATHNSDGSPKPTANSNGSAELTAATRANAINAFTATRQLDQLIAGIEARYKAGPGATSGIGGVLDYLPTPSNREFDDAGNAVRGAAITALGFTSGQTNSPREVEMNIGPYIPKAGDYDSQIEGKIARLKELRDRARVQAVTVLGGVPDASGRIAPLSQIPQQERERLFPPGTMQPELGGAVGARPDNIAPPAFNPGQPPQPPADGGIDQSRVLTVEPGNSPGQLDIPTGGTRTVDNPALAGVNARLAKMWQSGTPYTQIIEYMRSVGLDPSKGNAAELEAFRRKHPEYKGAYSVNVDDMTIPMSGAQQIMNRVGSGPIGAATMSAADTILPLGAMTGNPEVTNAILAGVQQNNPTASLVGTIGGGALGAGAMELGLGRLATRAPAAASRFLANPITADASFGGVQGYAGAEDGQGLRGAVEGSVAGAGGGMLGRSVTRGAANAVGGVRNAAIDELRTRGIPLTVGQMLSQSGRVGQAAKSMEDALTSIPIVGDMVNARRMEGLQGFNRSAMNEALAPIGQQAGEGLAEEGVNNARDLVSQAYDDALRGVRLSGNDPQFVTEMQGVFQRANRLPATMAENANYTLNSRIGESFDSNGELTGNAFQQSLRGLRRDAGAVRNQPYGHDFGNVTREAEQALEGLANRQAPEVVPALSRANEAYGRTGVVRDAVNAARNGSRSGDGGLFMPSQLMDAASKNSRRFGGTHATPDQPFFALNEAARNVLPSRLPDSGTFKRLAVGGTLAGAGGGADYATDSGGTIAGTGIGTAALLAALGTRRGQQVLTGMLGARPAAMREAADWLTQRQRVGGLIGAGAGTAAMPLLLGQ